MQPYDKASLFRISLRGLTWSRHVPSNGKEHEETGSGGVFGAGAGFPWGQGLIRHDAVSQDPGVEIKRAADAEVETIAIALMGPVSHHQSASHGIDDL